MGSSLGHGRQVDGIPSPSELGIMVGNQLMLERQSFFLCYIHLIQVLQIHSWLQGRSGLCLIINVEFKFVHRHCYLWFLKVDACRRIAWTSLVLRSWTIVQFLWSQTAYLFIYFFNRMRNIYRDVDTPKVCASTTRCSLIITWGILTIRSIR